MKYMTNPSCKKSKLPSSSLRINTKRKRDDQDDRVIFLILCDSQDASTIREGVIASLLRSVVYRHAGGDIEVISARSIFQVILENRVNLSRVRYLFVSSKMDNKQIQYDVISHLWRLRVEKDDEDTVQATGDSPLPWGQKRRPSPLDSGKNLIVYIPQEGPAPLKMPIEEVSSSDFKRVRENIHIVCK